MLTLFKQHARNEAVSSFTWAVVLGLLSFFFVYIWTALRSTGSMDQLQDLVNNAGGVVSSLFGKGTGLDTVDGWIAAYVLGPLIALFFVIFTALFVAGMITREVERHTLEFTLSLPVSRTQFLVSRWLVLAGALGVIHLGFFLGIVGGAAAFAPGASAGRYALALVNSFLLYLFLGGLMLLVSLFINDYAVGTGATLGVGLVPYFAYLALDGMTGALKTVRGLLPFAFWDAPSVILKGEVPWGNMAVLAVGALVFLALCVWVFQRKQIAT